MNVFLGILMAVIGLSMFISGFTKSNFIIYRLMVERSKRLWGEQVHNFYMVVGVIIIIVGILFSFGMF